MVSGTGSIVYKLPNSSIRFVIGIGRTIGREKWQVNRLCSSSWAQDAVSNLRTSRPPPAGVSPPPQLLSGSFRSSPFLNPLIYTYYCFWFPHIYTVNLLTFCIGLKDASIFLKIDSWFFFLTLAALMISISSFGRFTLAYSDFYFFSSLDIMITQLRSERNLFLLNYGVYEHTYSPLTRSIDIHFSSLLLFSSFWLLIEHNMILLPIFGR